MLFSILPATGYGWDRETSAGCKRSITPHHFGPLLKGIALYLSHLRLVGRLSHVDSCVTAIDESTIKVCEHMWFRCGQPLATNVLQEPGSAIK